MFIASTTQLQLIASMPAPRARYDEVVFVTHLSTSRPGDGDAVVFQVDGATGTAAG